MSKKIVTIDFDTDPTNPLKDWDGMWTLYHWNGRFRDDSNKWNWFTEDGKVPAGLQSKLRAGLAFWVHYQDHGSNGSRFWLDEDIKVEPDEVDGIFVWENPPSDMGAKSRADRFKDAQGDAKTYEDWCNGNVYGFSVEDEDENDINSCWGFYPDRDDNLSYMVDDINNNLDDHDRIVVRGPAAFAIHTSELKGIVLDEDEWKDYEDPDPEYHI